MIRLALSSRYKSTSQLMNVSLFLQSESVLIQKIYTHFKKAPGTHKLGVLYVVDSVTRKWLEQAKSQGQPINSSQDGTYAAGVHRVTELMPVLMNDILQSAPEDQKVRCSLSCDKFSNNTPAVNFPKSIHDSEVLYAIAAAAWYPSPWLPKECKKIRTSAEWTGPQQSSAINILHNSNIDKRLHILIFLSQM